MLLSGNSYRIQDYWTGAKQSADVMINIYGSLGRTIDMTGILNNKDFLKQSKFIKDFFKKDLTNANTADII